jgi:hypothetical protein
LQRQKDKKSFFNLNLFIMENQVLRVTELELQVILQNFKVVQGMAVFGSLFQATTPKMLVKDRITKEKNPFNVITKESKVSCIFNADYEKQVVNQLKREDKEETEYKKGFSAMELKFFGNNDFYCENVKNEKKVIRYRPNDKVKPTTEYFADNKKVSFDQVKNYLPEPSKATNQGTEKEILWRTVYLENIQEITLNKVKYIVIR